jgi:hypothetical protein
LNAHHSVIGTTLISGDNTASVYKKMLNIKNILLIYGLHAFYIVDIN